MHTYRFNFFFLNLNLKSVSLLPSPDKQQERHWLSVLVNAVLPDVEKLRSFTYRKKFNWRRLMT